MGRVKAYWVSVSIFIFHHAVVEGLADFLEGGSGAAVKDEIHLGIRTVLVGHCFLAVPEDGWLEFHGAGFVGAVDVAECGGKEEATEGLECFVDVDHVLGSRVQFLSRKSGGVVAVFLATHAASLDLENDVELGAFLEEFLGDGKVLGEVDHRAIEHVALEEGALSFRDAFAGGLEKRFQEAVHLFRVAMVRMEGNEDVVFFGEGVDCFRQDDCTKGRVVHIEPGGELSTTGRNLDDPVGVRVGKGLERTIGGGEGSDVDSRVGISALLGSIKHGTVLSWCGDWHCAGGLADGGEDDKGCVVRETLHEKQE